MLTHSIQVPTTPDAPPSELKGQNHKQEIIIRNLTQFDIFVTGSPYFYWGRFSKGPEPRIAAFSAMTFSVCNKYWHPGGVSGGNSFKVELDGNNKWDFAIGWEDPAMGTYSAGVKETTSAEEGYNSRTTNGNTIESKRWQGTDKDGDDKITFTLMASASPGSVVTYTIQQLVKV